MNATVDHITLLLQTTEGRVKFNKIWQAGGCELQLANRSRSDLMRDAYVLTPAHKACRLNHAIT